MLSRTLQRSPLIARSVRGPWPWEADHQMIHLKVGGRGRDDKTWSIYFCSELEPICWGLKTTSGNFMLGPWKKIMQHGTCMHQCWWTIFQLAANIHGLIQHHCTLAGRCLLEPSGQSTFYPLASHCQSYCHKTP